MKTKIKILAGTSTLACFCYVLAAKASGIVIPGGTGLPDPDDHTGEGPVVQVIANVLSWILTVFLLLAVISFVVTGIQYILAFGSSYGIEKAKNNFVYSIIAVSVVGGAMIILYTINMLLL